MFKINKTKGFYLIIRISLLVIIIYTLILIFLSQDKSDSGKSRNAFIALQAVFLLTSTFIPKIISRSLKLSIPNALEIVFVLFCIACLFLGEICNFYAYVVWWDALLHTISGTMLAIIGLSFINQLNETGKIDISPRFVGLFVVCFAVFIGVLWEIIEYLIDSFFKTNMQRYKDSITLINFQGREALNDTMKDLILDTLGATFIGIIGYLDQKLKKEWFKKLYITTNTTTKT